MNYYESIVINYLRANRATFVNTQYCIQLKEGPNPDKQKGEHWYCDAVALSFNDPRTIFLCEISYEASLSKLLNRLKDWDKHWKGIRAAIVRDSSLKEPAESWKIQPWLFVPEKCKEKLKQGIETMKSTKELAFEVRVKALEEVQPWKYQSWNRKHDEA